MDSTRKLLDLLTKRIGDYTQMIMQKDSKGIEQFADLIRVTINKLYENDDAKEKRIKELGGLLGMVVDFIPFNMHLDYEKDLHDEIQNALQEAGGEDE